MDEIQLPTPEQVLAIQEEMSKKFLNDFLHKLKLLTKECLEKGENTVNFKKILAGSDFYLKDSHYNKVFETYNNWLNEQGWRAINGGECAFLVIKNQEEFVIAKSKQGFWKVFTKR